MAENSKLFRFVTVVALQHLWRLPCMILAIALITVTYVFGCSLEVSRAGSSVACSVEMHPKANGFLDVLMNFFLNYENAASAILWALLLSRAIV